MLNWQGILTTQSKKLHRVILFSLFAVLTACNTVVKDGPPRYDVDVSRIPDAQPKVESKSRIGNKPYQVFGKRYQVMGSSKNFKERGVASWYGSKFHAHNTSSGEPYDMLGMTAAHRSLPLPTYVQVRNLNNDKIVIVKVNDRGPFASSRIIDLSYAAAKKLGIVGHGTARVEITSVDPRDNQHTVSHTSIFAANNTPPGAPPLTKQTQPAEVYLQVGAFSNRLYAEKLQKHLTSVVHSPVQITKLYRSKILYRVQVGPIKDQATKAKIARQLSLLGLNGKVLYA